MPIIYFEGEGKQSQAERGSKVMSVCDEAKSQIPFGCRRGVCGTCVIEVLEGIENLAPADLQEESTRQDIGAGPTHRLACQARIRGDIKIRAADLGIGESK